MGDRERRKLTGEEIAKLEAWAAVRVPFDDVCTLLDMSATQLRELIKKDDTVRRAMDRGKAKSTHRARRTLYDMAVGRPTRRDPESGDVLENALDPDFQALKFWCQTQEGFKIATSVEVSGTDGNPIETTEVSRAERLERIAVAQAKLKAIKENA